MHFLEKFLLSRRNLSYLVLVALIGSLLLQVIGDFSAPRRARAASPITVNSAVDTYPGVQPADGDGTKCTLRKAIANANATALPMPFPNDCPAGDTTGLDTIDLSGAASITLNTNLGELFISQDLTINNTATIGGANGTRIFRIQGGAKLSLTGLTLQNGKVSTGSGGAILIDNGSLNVTASNFISNSAGSGGGAVAVIPSSGSGTATFTGVTFTNNKSDAEGGALYLSGSAAAAITGSAFISNKAGTKGGAIYNKANKDDQIVPGPVAINGVTFNLNSVDPVDPQNPPTDSTYGGGAIYNDNGGVLQISAALMTNNSTSITDGRGGAIYNAYGGWLWLDKTNVMLNSLSSGSKGYGAGIYNRAMMTLSNDSITNNTNNAGSGGGVASDSSASDSALIINSTIANNSATSGNGGGLYHFQAYGTTQLSLLNVTISGNSANASKGDGLYADGGDITLKNTIVENSSSVTCALNTGSITDGGKNLQWPGTSCGAGITSADPKLDSLLPNIGPYIIAPALTLSKALKSGSAANGTGANNVCSNPITVQIASYTIPVFPGNLDQRGMPRPAGAPNCDIGAYEANSGPVYSSTPPPLSTINISTTTGNAKSSTIDITNTGTDPLNITGASFSQGGTGLTLQPGSSLPFSIGDSQSPHLILTVQCTAAAPGLYTGTVSVAHNAANDNPATYTINCYVNPPILTANPTSLNFAATVGGGNPASQAVNVGNQAGSYTSLNWNVGAINYSQGNGWFACTPTSGTNLAAGSTSPVDCQVNGTGLAVGTYNASFQITSNTAGVVGSPQDISVQFVVNPVPVPPTLTASPTSLTFNATAGGGNPSPKTVTVGNQAGSSGPLNWSVGTINYSQGNGWLNCTPTSGTNLAAGATSPVSCTATTGALAAGTYNASFQITSNTANVAGSPQTINVQFVVSAPLTPPTLQVSPLQLTFNGIVSGNAPVAQTVSIGNQAGSNGPLDWTVSAINYSQGNGWLACTPTSGTSLAAGATAPVSCSVTIGALAAGTYNASFQVTSNTANVLGSPQTVNVQLVMSTQTPPPTLTVSPGLLTFNATAGGGNPLAQTVTVGNQAGTSGPLDWSIGAISYSQGNGWLACTPTSGTNLAAGSTTAVSCSVTTGALAAGTYNASFQVTSNTANVAGSPQTVQVQFVVSPPSIPPTLTASPTSLTFNATAGGASPASQTVTVGNQAGASGPLNWSVGAINYSQGNGWLNCTPTSGTNLAAGSTSPVSCTATTGALAAGTYNASFQVTSNTANVAGSPQAISVQFVVAAAPTPPTLTATPTSLTFNATVGGGNPVAQTVTVGNLAGANGPLNWNVGAINYSQGNGWLNCTPTSGTNLAAGSTTQVSCTATTGALAVGTYNASFQITSNTANVSGSPKTINVQFVIATGPTPPTLTATPTSLNFSATAGGASPASQSVTVGNQAGSSGPLDWNVGAVNYSQGNGWLNCTPTSGTSLTAGSTAPVSCSATTGALAAGTYNASFQITSNTANVVGSPKTISVQFVVGQPQPGTPGFGSDPAPGSAISLGGTKPGSTTTRPLVVFETGTADLVVNSYNLGGANASNFALNGSGFPFTIQDGAAAVQLGLSCTPDGFGLRNASLSFNTNAGTQSYSLTCAGVNDKEGGPPSDLIPQLRETPDRVAANDHENTVTYTFKVKNIGFGAATYPRIEFPVDEHLEIGYASFSDPRAWVTNVYTDKVLISLPTIEPNSVITGVLVFRPSLANPPVPGSKVFTRYKIKYDDPAASGRERLSNGVAFVYGEPGSNLDVSKGDVQLMNPVSTEAGAGSRVTFQANFFIPDEVVTVWITDAAGVSKTVQAGPADHNGEYSINLDTTGLAPGSYAVAAFGNRSEITGIGILNLK